MNNLLSQFVNGYEMIPAKDVMMNMLVDKDTAKEHTALPSLMLPVNELKNKLYDSLCAADQGFMGLCKDFIEEEANEI